MSFLLRTYTEIRSFAEKALPHLLRDEPRNNLQLGLLRRGLNDSTFAFDELATAESSAGQVIGVLTRTLECSFIISVLPYRTHAAVIAAIAQRMTANVVPHTRLDTLTLQSISPPQVAPG